MMLSVCQCYLMVTIFLQHLQMTFFRGHEAAVLCVRFDDCKIVSGSCDKTIKVWKS